MLLPGWIWSGLVTSPIWGRTSGYPYGSSRLAFFGGFHGPVLAAMLLEEMERAELHDPDTMPPGDARLNSRVTATIGA